MTGWLVLIGVVVAALLLLWLTGVRGAMLQMCAAALMFGSAGYAIQGNPGLPSASPKLRSEDQALVMTGARHAFYGNFSAEERWLLLSESLARRGNTEDAARLLSSTVKRYPGSPHLWVGLGNALVDHSGSLTPASEFAYRRAAELSPGYPAPGFFYGLARARSGDKAGALASWRSVLADAPADAEWRPLVVGAIAVLDPAAERQQPPAEETP